MARMMIPSFTSPVALAIGALSALAACGDAGGTSAGATSSSTTTEATATTATTNLVSTAESATDSITTAIPTTTTTTTTVPTTTAPTTTGATSSTGGPDETTGDPSTTTSDTSTTTGGVVERGACAESVDGWCWTNPLPLGNILRDIWSDGAGRTWIVGEGNTIMWNTGDGWQTRPADRVEGLRGVWGSAPDDIWAVGDFGLILHFDGIQWSPVASPTKKWLRGMWGSGAADVWAVGDFGTLLHFDGKAWSVYDPGFKLASMLSVWGLAADDVWVGFEGGSAMHWNGAAWSYMGPDNQGVTSLWGRGPQDVYATSALNPLLTHYTGVQPWANGGVALNAGALYAVTGTDDELWAGGTQILLHNDGGGWVKEQQFVQTQTLALERIDDEILMAGRGGVIARRKDDAWGFEAGDPQRVFLGFSSIAGTSEHDIWAGGGELAHWDGEAWTFVDIGLGSNRFGDMSTADGVIWALAHDANVQLWRNDGKDWSKVTETFGAGAHSVWAVDANTAWISGSFLGSKLQHWDGQTLTPYMFPNWVTDVRGLHGLAPDDIWAVGSPELLMHWNGEAWTIVHTGTNALTAVWAVGPDDVWSADEDGEFYHWDGVTWATFPGSNWPINDMRGTAPDDIWAVGGITTVRGTTWHYDGVAWTEKISGSGEVLISLWASDEAMWAVGAQYVALRRPHM